MKKLFIAILAFAGVYFYAQITLTKDLSFGNNGIVEIGMKTNSMLQLSYYNTPTFLQAEKLFINQPLFDSSGSFSGRRFFKLNQNGTPDSTFGTSGVISVPTTDYESDSFYADSNQFYLNTGEKYLSNGQTDTGFGNINSLLTTPYHHYKIVLSDGKIISRNQQSISKYQSTGFPDTSFGNNGVNNLIPSLHNTNTSFGELIYYDNDFLYETVIAVGASPYIRKINLNTGNLDLSYGQNGYSQFSQTLGNPVMYCGSSPVSQSNTSFINNHKNGADGQLTKTDSYGNLDSNFGINGKIDYADYYLFNGEGYSSAEIKPLLYNNYILLLSNSYNSNGTVVPTKYGFRGYDNSGNPLTINGNLHYVFQGIDVMDTMTILIKDNYLYVFFDNKIARYILGNATLSTSEVFEDKNLVNFVNPFRDELNLNTNEKIKSIKIYDETGRLVLKSDAAKNINTSSLSKGIYIIKIITGSNQIISKKGIKD